MGKNSDEIQPIELATLAIMWLRCGETITSSQATGCSKHHVRQLVAAKFLEEIPPKRSGASSGYHYTDAGAQKAEQLKENGVQALITYTEKRIALLGLFVQTDKSLSAQTDESLSNQAESFSVAELAGATGLSKLDVSDALRGFADYELIATEIDKENRPIQRITEKGHALHALLHSQT